MAFWSTLISTVIKMIIVAAAAFGGILTGKHLRERKNAKNTAEAEK